MTDTQEVPLKDFLFADVICYTLLSLYMNVAYSKRYIPVKTRNDILLKQLKVYSKKQKYKSVKADVRRLIHYGRKSGLALEEKILEIQSLSTNQSIPISEGSDLSRFQEWLEALNNLCTIDTEGFVESKAISKDAVYLNREEVIASFDERGNLFESIKIYIPSDKWGAAVSSCERSGCNLANYANYRSTHIVGEFSVPSNV